MYQKVFLSVCAINYCLGQSFNSPPLDWIQTDGTGAYRYGYATGDEGRHYHVSSASADNTVAGRFGYKDPATGGDLQTTYTAGRRGFRARGPHIARRMDLSQSRPPFSRPNNDGQYHPELDNIFDPNEDRGYDFSYRTPDHIKEEHANRVGDVQGRYSYLDDIGFRHNVDYIAGSKTGFVVTNPVPDTFAQARGGPLYYVGKTGGSKVRGFSAIQKQLNGAYRFLASGPDHKRSEISDASGNRRGVYTYLDDKGVQHTVEYIAGPKIGYKVINNKKGVNYNPVLPFFPDSSTIQPLFPSAVGGDSGGGNLLGPFPTVPSSPASSSGGGKFPSLSPSGGKFPSLPPSGGKFPSISPSGGPVYPSSPSPGGSPSPSLPPSIPSGSSKPASGRPPSGIESSTFRPSSLFEPASGKPPSLLEPSSSLPPFPYDTPDDFPSISPSFPSTTPFPIPARPQKPSDFDISGQKWNFDLDYFFNDPSNANKDWSVKPGKGDSDKNFKGGSHSTPKPPLIAPPTFDPFDDFPPVTFPSPSFLPPEGFDEGLNTAESSAGFKPGFGDEKKNDCNNTRDGDFKNKGEGFGEGGKRNDSQTDTRHPFPDSGYKNTKESGAKHYYKGHKSLAYPSRGTVKFGGVKKNEWHKGKDEEGYFAIPPGVAVRAHVQSLDIVPYNKRFISPGEALEHHHADDKKHVEN